MTDSPEGASAREHWSSRLVFLLAITGASVGLGNLWRFPYIAGENGGGAFVLVYLGFILVIGVPLIMAELALARRGASNPVATLSAVCRERGCSRIWMGIGWFSVLAPPLATTFYSVIAGWSLYYLVKSLGLGLSGLDAESATGMFEGMLADPLTLVGLHTVYLAAVVAVVGRGIRRGIEGVTKIMMPLLFVLLLVLATYAAVAGDGAAGWRFLFAPDFSALDGNVVLMALGQALFSVSVGTGAILTYGSYMTGDVSIPGAAWTLGLVDTLTALLAGLAIFPIVFAAGLQPSEGPGLMFVTLPIALGNMPGGAILGILFFLLLFMAAFTSSLAMLEPFVSWVTENRGIPRFRATVLTGLGIWAVGLTTVFSFNLLKDFKPLGGVPMLADRTVFGIIEFSVSNLMLPVNALMIALLAGWALGSRYMVERIGLQGAAGRRAWSLAARYLAPAALAAVFVFNL
ncbi:sodium-dependent transporter [Elongatibacter sediminis]|uniref:Transporter n=1 Tax=Elongatibacter sediminis TaxID=3119006 RepID=A0AAW9R7M4_9GAMM